MPPMHRMQFFTLSSSKIEVSETYFFDIVTQNDHPTYVWYHTLMCAHKSGQHRNKLRIDERREALHRQSIACLQLGGTPPRNTIRSYATFTPPPPTNTTAKRRLVDISRLILQGIALSN